MRLLHFACKDKRKDYDILMFMHKIDQTRTPYIEGLIKYVQENRLPFHMPGHKQGQGMHPLLKNILGDEVFKYDLTEVDGVDYLHNPAGILKEAQDLAAELYKVDQTFFLINGSTVGNQAAILTMANRGEKVLVTRNAHRSIYGSLALGGLIPVYLQPLYDQNLGMTTFPLPQQLDDALKKDSSIKGVILTSPNYYGFSAYIKEFIDITHRYNLPILVDEAHGAHYPFHPQLPPSAIEYGADLVLHSTHKTLGSFTQSSLLHINEGKIDTYKLKSYLNILESSSPNYLLLMSLDAARMQMATQGYELLSNAIASAEWLRNEINSISGLQVYTAEIAKASPAIADMDPTKLTVLVDGIGLTGYQVDKILGRELKVEPELADHKNVLLFITIGEDVGRMREVKKAFEVLAVKYRNTAKLITYPHPPPLPPQELTPEEALRTSSESVDLLSSLGRVSAQIVTPYPPGLPVVSYGEKITSEVIEYIQELLEIGAEVHGLNGEDHNPKIRVVS